MCLSIIAKIVELLDSKHAVADISGVKKKINISLLGGTVELNDWVLIHTGFAIAKISEEKARAILEAYADPVS
jgi:hydrogenase expression/formation protein HypC